MSARATGTFKKILKLTNKGAWINAIRGGSSGGKTRGIVKTLILLAENDDKPTITSIVSDTMPNIRKGVLRDFEQTLVELGIDVKFHGTRVIYTFRSGSIIEFFSIKDLKDAKGPRRHRLYINEANRLSYEPCRQLIKRSAKVWACWNPDNRFWIDEHYLDLNGTKVMVDGVEETLTAELLQVCYKDNEFCPLADKIELETHKYEKDAGGDFVLNDEGEKIITNYYNVYGLGNIGDVQGLIHENVFLYEDLPDNRDFSRGIGLDFGWETAGGAVDMNVDFDKKEVYLREIYYGLKIDNEKIAQHLKEDEFYNEYVNIFCDNASPSNIYELKNTYKLSAYSCKKIPVVDFLRRRKKFKTFIYKGSRNLIYERSHYKFKINPDGTMSNEQIKKDDHLMDGWRYGETGIFNANRHSI